MLIDWFTVIAQALNFALLVWLMKRFLYKPILDAIAAREARIAAELADAADKQAEATREREDFAQKNREIDEARASLLDQATAEASAERARLLDEARAEADALSARREIALRNSARELRQSLRQRAQDEVFAIARQALSQLAAASLEERLTAVFVQRLQELDEPARASLRDAIARAGDRALVRSAFPLPEEERQRVSRAVNQAFAAEIALSFVEAPALINGLELSAEGLKVSWSIADYLDTLQAGVDELLPTEPSGRP